MFLDLYMLYSYVTIFFYYHFACKYIRFFLKKKTGFHLPACLSDAFGLLPAPFYYDRKKILTLIKEHVFYNFVFRRILQFFHPSQFILMILIRRLMQIF